MNNRKDRRRRSLVWVNVLEEGKLQKAVESDVDCIVMDLEDTLPINQKEKGRKETAKVLKEFDFRGKERIVRINHLGSEWAMKDLEEILPAIPDAIRLPKCETVEYVLELDKILTGFEEQEKLERNSIGMILMIETPLGIINAYEMAKCTERIYAIGIGLEDLTTSLHVIRKYELNSQEMIYARQKVIIAGRAAGVQVLDSSALIDNEEFIYQDSVNSRSFGFDGRSMVNLSQVEAINKAFTPTLEDVEWAKEVLATYHRYQNGEQKPYYKGCFIDIPVVAKAKHILATAGQS